MNEHHRQHVLELLANGRTPGEIAESHPVISPVEIQVTMQEACAMAKNTTPGINPLNRAGAPWLVEEDKVLAEAVEGILENVVVGKEQVSPRDLAIAMMRKLLLILSDGSMEIQRLARHHGRSTGAIRSRVLKLVGEGKLA